MKPKYFGMMALGAVLPLAGAMAALLSGGAMATDLTSPAGEAPILKTGNFVADTDQDICFQIFGDGWTSDMVGFKVDSGPKICDAYGNCQGQQAGDFSNGEVSFDVSDDGKYLSWTAIAGVRMLGVVVKGATNYNLYDYLNPLPTTNPYMGDNDAGLHSPVNKKGLIPQISHYNVCYIPDQGGDEQGQGCSPGYWGNHLDRWAGVSPTAEMNTTFGVDTFGDIYACTKVKGVETCTYVREMTLEDAFNPNASSECPSCSAFAQHAVAALLNSYGGTPNGDVDNSPIPYPDNGNITGYPWTPAEVIAAVQDAITNGTEQSFLTTFDLYGDYDAPNKLWCPLTGTKTTK